jgi:AraC-like DNA-binding protein
LEGLFADIQEASSASESALNSAGLAYLLLSSWEAFRTSEGAVEGHDVHPAVEKAARILRDETYAGDLTRLACAVGLSPSRLSRLFKKQVGLSVSQFRNESRLERFLEIYGRGRRVGALEAALEAGFGSYSQFYRVFRLAIGENPNEYRRKLDGAQSIAPGELPSATVKSEGVVADPPDEVGLDARRGEPGCGVRA